MELEIADISKTFCVTSCEYVYAAKQFNFCQIHPVLNVKSSMEHLVTVLLVSKAYNPMARSSEVTFH